MASEASAGLTPPAESMPQDEEREMGPEAAKIAPASSEPEERQEAHTEIGTVEHNPNIVNAERIQGEVAELCESTAELSVASEEFAKKTVSLDGETSHAGKSAVTSNEEQSRKRPEDAVKSKAEMQKPVDFDDKTTEDSRPEIQTIMQQFQGSTLDTHLDPITSPTSSSLPIFQYPARSSSLELPSTITSTHASSSLTKHPGQSMSDSASTSHDLEKNSAVPAPPLPEPDAESDLPFDFHRFLEQLRHRTADPVARFLRSFLQEFGKKQWMVHEQVKIIFDFLTFIGNRMAQCEIWRTVSEAEFDNAREGMEKLVMNRLYTQTFSPEIPSMEPAKGRRKGTLAPLTSGRRGQHQEDVERDEVLAQKVRIYGWIREEHLDIKPFVDKGRKFLVLAQQELSKIKNYRAPRDKVICVLNCCKVLFGYLRNAQSEQSADDFIPLLIYTVLKANPEHLVSNVQYILRFRHQDKLSGEAGYYMSSLMGAVQFIENLDRTSLTVSDEEFEENVEKAVSAIAERDEQEASANSEKIPSSPRLPFNEKGTASRPVMSPFHMLEGEKSNPRRMIQGRGNTSLGTDSSGGTSDDGEEITAVTGLLRTIQKPLSTIGRIFSEETPDSRRRHSSGPALTPQSGPTPRASPGPALTASEQQSLSASGIVPPTAGTPGAAAEANRQRFQAEDAAARQASAETAEAYRLQQAEHQTVVETLAGMFPGLDRDVIGDVVRLKQGRVGLAVDACLALSR